MLFTNEAMAKACANLEKVLKATGAVVDGNGDYHYLFRTLLWNNAVTFHIRPCVIQRGYLGTLAATCWMMDASIPWEENVASVLLLLKHNPGLFEYWAAHPGKRLA